MADLLLCWLLAPAGLLLAVVGLSLLLERLLDLSLPWTVRPALGMAVAIVLAELGTMTPSSAKLTLGAILALAALGLAIGFRVPERLPDRAEVGVAVGVFALLALPFLVIGEATWAGFIKLDDTATWMAFADHAFEYGREVGPLAPSTHQQVIADHFAGGYPIGSFVPVALMSKLSGQDVAFTMQPSMAFAVAALALLLLDLARRLVRGAWAPAAIAILASLSSILLGYYLWGGVKELVAAALLPLPAVLAGWAAREEWPRRAWAPIGLSIGAMTMVLGPGGAFWLLPTLAPALVGELREIGLRGTLRLAWPVAALAALLALPVVFTPEGVMHVFGEEVTVKGELGNLWHPLNPLQAAGIWPTIDFRGDPRLKPLTIGLSLLCLAIAAATLVAAARCGRGRGLPLVGYVGGGALGAAAIAAFGSAWIDAKTIATISPAVLAAALIGVAMLGQRSGFRFEAAALATVLAGFVAWSAFLAYQGISFAPRAPNLELEKIGERFAGEGPALSTEVSIYGPRHFLRKLDAEGASDRRRRPVYLRDGTEPAKGQAVDLDEIRTDQLDPYSLLVVRRSPEASRPGANWALAYSGTYYDVWRRRPSPGTLAEHLPLGEPLDAGGVASCPEVRRLAGLAGTGGKLIAARAGSPIAVNLAEVASKPAAWTNPTPYTVLPTGSGTLSTEIAVSSGVYELWLGGSVFGGMTVRIDGEEVASERAAVENQGALEPLGPVRLPAGQHLLELEYSGADLWPGSAATPYEVGPLLLASPERADRGLVTVRPAGYRRLCGRRWDWIEAYSR